MCVSGGGVFFLVVVVVEVGGQIYVCVVFWRGGCTADIDSMRAGLVHKTAEGSMEGEVESILPQLSQRRIHAECCESRAGSSNSDWFEVA